jgi:hypothetical protein
VTQQKRTQLLAHDAHRPHGRLSGADQIAHRLVRHIWHPDCGQQAQFLRQFAVALTGFVRRKLNRDGEEAVLIAGDMALEQGNDVACGGH